MKLRREASLGIGALLALQILQSMLAIALLTRMGPAIEQILQENVYSGEAVEEMTALLANNPEPGPIPEGFDQALKRAQDNVTEDPERPILETIQQSKQAAFAGNQDARTKTVQALRKLGQVNRDSMILADEKAKRLSQTGAWAAALLGALGLALGILAYRRLRLRLELPIEELRRTTKHIREGSMQARCVVGAGPQEVKQIANDLNWMLDKWLHNTPNGTPERDETRETEVRRALAFLLEQETAPAAIFDANDRKVAANLSGLVIETALHDQVDGNAWTVDEIPGTSLRFARFVSAPK